MSSPRSSASTSASSSEFLFQERFNRSDTLLTNEYSYWNPNDPAAAKSSVWEMTSGSLFVSNEQGYSGKPDNVAPTGQSTQGTNSAIFRLNTTKFDFGNVRVNTRLNVMRFSSTPSTPTVDWDGVHIFLRYQNEQELYYASVSRRDGKIVAKKKCKGGPSNGGTYYELGSGVSGYQIPTDHWQDVGASIRTETNGTVTITVYQNGKAVGTMTDRGVGCSPITQEGAVGIRADNVEFRFDDFEVNSL